MKLLLTAFYLLFAYYALSQKLTKNEKDLFNRLNQINLTESLSKQIDSLENVITRTQSSVDYCYVQNQRTEQVIDYYKQQIFFRELLDKLEQGDLDFYKDDAMGAKWRGIVSTSAGEKGLVIHAYVDTLHDELSVGKQLLEKDSMFLKIYPHVYHLIETGTVVFEYSEFQIMYKMKSQVPRLKFPSLTITTQNPSAKKKVANEWYYFISVTAGGQIEGDVIPVYLQLEKKLIPDNNIDKQIFYRRKFIEYLKKLYENK